MPGAPIAPAAACDVVESTRVSHHGHTGNTRHSPHNGFNGFLRALPGDRAFLPPSPLRSLLLKNLTPASGRQGHTTSPSASSAARLAAPSASTASRPAFVTCATPLCGTGWGELVEMICPTGRAEYFFAHDWTGKIRLICFRKFRFARKWRRSRSPSSRTPDVLGRRERAARDNSQSCLRTGTVLDSVRLYDISEVTEMSETNESFT